MNAVSLCGRTILVVEDEALIAFDVAKTIERAGASVLLARTLKHGMQLADRPEVSAAVLDFGLVDGEASELCQRLRRRAVPFVLYSGYSHLAEACRSGIVVPKPASPEALIDALNKALMRGGE